MKSQRDMYHSVLDDPPDGILVCGEIVTQPMFKLKDDVDALSYDKYTFYADLYHIDRWTIR